MRIQQDKKLDFSDVLIVPQRSELGSRSEVTIEREFKFKHSKQTLEVFPLIAANMDSVGSMAMAKKLMEFNALVALHKFYSVEKLAEYFNQYNYGIGNAFYTVGANVEDLKKLKAVKELVKDPEFPRMICLDAANGYSKHFVGHLKALREAYPNAIIMAGNVVTPNMTEELILQGADIVKVGLGNGSVCLTRLRTGVGYPQLSAVAECSFVAHGLGAHIVSDGGCTCEGDICKAFCAGADFVMTGSMLTATDECEGQWEYDLGKPYHLYVNSGEVAKDVTLKLSQHMPALGVDPKKTFFKYHGMSSQEAQEQWYGGLASYRAAEGKEVRIPYRGPVENIMKSITGGVRSCATYVGAKKIKDLPKCAEFIQVNNQLNRIYS
jgi:GMP reductase